MYINICLYIGGPEIRNSPANMNEQRREERNVAYVGNFISNILETIF